MDPNAIDMNDNTNKSKQPEVSPDGVNLNVNGEATAPSVETPKNRTDQIFEKMDTDKNGVITESEFINGCLQDKFLYQMLTADYSDNN